MLKIMTLNYANLLKLPRKLMTIQNVKAQHFSVFRNFTLKELNLLIEFQLSGAVQSIS